MTEEPVIHGVNCPKVQHDQRGGYLHDADDDSAYDVDGVDYCGRCHVFLVMEKKKRWDEPQ